MPLLNRPGVDVSHLEFFVARAQVPRDVQLCAMRFRATPRTEHRTNALLVPFPTDAPAAARAQDVVRVGDLNDGYSELFLDLARNFIDDDDHADDDDDESGTLAAPDDDTGVSLPCARKVAVRVCSDWNELLQFREKGFRLSKTLKPILQHYYSDDYAFIVCFLDFEPNVTQLVELTFTFPISNEIDDALFVPALTRPPSTATPSFDFLVYSVNSGRSGGSSTDECARRLYRKLSALVHSDAEHQALLAAAKRHELRTALLPVRLVDIVELRRLHVRRKQRNEDLVLELDEATQIYFRAVRALKEPGAPASVERLLDKCLAHNAQHVAALTMLANLLQQDDARTEEAEKKFRLLLRANPVRADSLQNFALFVELKMKDHDTAEVLYTRALSIEPTNPRVLANFAVFLKNVRHDYDFADALYKRAIQAAPTSANTIGNYALFLYSVRGDNLKADQLFRLAISLEERAAANVDSASSSTLLEPAAAAAVAAFWKRRYEAFLEALQRTGQLQALLNSQLPPLAIPRTADVERLERLNRKRTEEQKQRDSERAAVERAARRKAQRLPAAVVRCVRALVGGWRGVSPTDACVCLQRDDMHVPQLEADDAASDDAQADGAAVACTCDGGRAGDIASSVLFRRARDACVEATYDRALHAIQNDDAARVVDGAAEDEIDRLAVADTTGASGARGARECMIRALNVLRGRESRLTRRCYHAMAALVAAALNAAFAVDAFAQCRDLMHMANTYRLDDLGVAEELQRGASSHGLQQDDDGGSSLESLTASLESSEEDGGIRAPSAASGATTAMVAAQPAGDANGSHAVKREAAMRASRLTTMSRSLTLLRLLRASAAAVWRSRVFWESALTDELRTQQLRQSGGGGGASAANDKHGADVFDSSEVLNEGDARTTALVLGQVASFATMMVHLDCDFDFIADFVDKQCVVFNLPTATRDDLLQHAATASLVETMRDVSFSND